MWPLAIEFVTSCVTSLNPAWPTYGKISTTVLGMITAVHALVYADDAQAARAFFRDVLGWPPDDAHGGDPDAHRLDSVSVRIGRRHR